MKNTPATTSCIRCGKMRIVVQTWTEIINQSTTSYTQSVCPDPECQKIVEKELQKKNEKVKELQEQSLRRKANFRKNLHKS